MVVYKIVAADEWREAEAAGVFVGAAIDRADGFIHFSTAEQAPETAAKWFAGREDLTLAAVDAEALGSDLRWEPSRGGALFPHLYAPLPMSAVVWSRPLKLGPERAPFVRDPRGMRLARVAGHVLERLPAETAHRAAINALKIAPPSKSPPADPRLAVEILGLALSQPARACRRLRQERRSPRRDAEVRFRLRRGRYADAAAAGRATPGRACFA